MLLNLLVYLCTAYGAYQLGGYAADFVCRVYWAGHQAFCYVRARRKMQRNFDGRRLGLLWSLRMFFLIWGCYVYDPSDHRITCLFDRDTGWWANFYGPKRIWELGSITYSG